VASTNRNSTCIFSGRVQHTRTLRRGTMIAFKKILFPTDFSPSAEKALAHAIRLADFDDCEVIVQHVVGNYFEKHPHWATLFDVRELQKFLDGYVSAHMAEILPSDSGKFACARSSRRASRPMKLLPLLTANWWTW